MSVIYKVGALIFDDHHRVLAVHKKDKPKNEYIVPGGKIEANESDEMALQRELYEELNVHVEDSQYYEQFEGVAIYEPSLLVMRTYLVRINGVLSPSSEIDEFVWLDANYQAYGYTFASILGKQILPRLVMEGKIR